ncbi:MCE family protein [Nocardia goodfellowii]|uniref:MCE family protein n=1 Tax=Nocardia goodfellowii TaxID=882446 RepID=UPI001AE43BAD|nr:MlaD family protein [Nocardia goodfellowii]
MLTRFVRTQLIIFAILSVIGLVVMATVYMRLPTLAGIGSYNVTVELPAAGGLYRFGNVTYRGVEIGKVTRVELIDGRVRATLAISGSWRIPADLDAEVRSVSAVGEQYVELRPRTDSPPYLQEGSVIAERDTAIPDPVGPMLDRLSALVDTIPADKLHDLLGELFQGMNGAAYDLDSLLTSAGTLAADLNGVGATTRALAEDTAPLLDSQARTADAIRIWTRSLSGVTAQLVADDPHIRTLLRTGPGAAGEVARLLDSVRLTLPVLLANLSSVGQLGVTYHAALEQVLVLLPPAISMIEAVHPTNNASGWGLGDFRLSGTSDPPACTVGFLPPSSWRLPSDITTIDTPEGMYCKLPQDSAIAVRGARNYPCLGRPGKRAPTAALCNSDEEFQPVAGEQPVVGPYPRDPELEDQGVPPDSRYGPAESGPPGADNLLTPSVGIARYDPGTGRYVGPDGSLYRQTDLTRPGVAAWKDMLPH